MSTIIVIYILRLLIFVCISIIMFIAYKEIYKKFNKKIEEAQLKQVYKNNGLKKLEKYVYKKEKCSNYLKNLEEKLIKQGNPFKLSALMYCLLKVIISLVAFCISIFSKNNLIVVIGVTILGFFSLDLIYYMSDKDDQRKILIDLPDICDILDIQTSANVQLGLALTEVYDIPKSKRFKNALMELAAEINLTKNPEMALDNFIKNFNLVELESFILSIKQALKTGRSKEIIANNSEVLKENNIFNIQKKTEYLTQYLILIALMLFIGACALIGFSFTKQIQSNLSNIMGN